MALRPFKSCRMEEETLAGGYQGLLSHFSYQWCGQVICGLVEASAIGDQTGYGAQRVRAVTPESSSERPV